MPITTYVARYPGPFAALVQAATLGGFRLEPLPPIRVQDRYWDTADGELLRLGYGLRVRDVDGLRAAALRPLRPETGGRAADAELGPTPSAEPAGLRLPPGPLADAVADVLGVADERPADGRFALVPLLGLRQFRTPRIAYDDARPVALLSFDVVVYEAADGTHRVANEAEVELDRQGGPADLLDLDPALREHGLEPSPRTKLERGVLTLGRDADAPLLLLPDEREALDVLADGADAAHRRRARILLLDARGYRPDTIASQTGVSASRVRAWTAQFRATRMDLFRDPEPEPVPSYRISELVETPTGGDGGVAPARSAGDGAAAPPTTPPPEPDTDAADLASFLDQFTPGSTDTPLFDGSALLDDLDDDADDDEPDTSAQPAPPRGVVASSDPAADPAPRDPFAAEAVDPPAPAGADATAPDRSSAPRRPALTGRMPLLDAARRTLAYHVAAFDHAVGRFGAEPTPTSAHRLLLAVHRVRLAVETFAPTLPGAATTRLIAALRPLAEALDRALDADRAAALPTADAARLGAHRDHALAEVRARLGGGRQQAWGARARRLLERLHAQQADGLLVGDDFAAAPDDFVGERGSVPVPSRLRHGVGSILWTRFEALLAFEDEVAGIDAASPAEVRETAYHLAAAISALHFALGLAARATGGSVREASAALDAAEARVADARHAAAAAALAGPEGPGALGAVVGEVWAEVTGPEARARLAAVAVGV